MSLERGGIAHGLVQTARGMCTDERPYEELDALLGQAVDAVKDVEAERDRLRSAIEEHLLWEPGRAGHAAATDRLRDAMTQSFDPLDPCLSCDGRDEHHEPSCYFAPILDEERPVVRAEGGDNG